MSLVVLPQPERGKSDCKTKVACLSCQTLLPPGPADSLGLSPFPSHLLDVVSGHLQALTVSGLSAHIKLLTGICKHSLMVLSLCVCEFNNPISFYITSDPSKTLSGLGEMGQILWLIPVRTLLVVIVGGSAGKTIFSLSA